METDVAPAPAQHASTSRVGSALGARLRQCRLSRRLSLLDVQARTGGEFKASALGAYERGERALTVERLTRLAEVYEVGVGEVLGIETALDLPALEAAEERAREAREDDFVGSALLRFAAYVRAIRGEPTTMPLPVRATDSEFLSVLLGRAQAEIERRLGRLGLRVPEGVAEEPHSRTAQTERSRR
jgi:transcriptional regulator with XRE-family HTH domain